jgi:hypothetical protein
LPSHNYKIILIFKKKLNMLIYTTLFSESQMTGNVCYNKECCRIDAVVTVDAKGQIVLPKDLREKAKIKPNDKWQSSVFNLTAKFAAL